MLLSEEYINESSRAYSIYTCESRAIPKAADGLKDAQRKALWLIRNKAEKMKTVSLAGELLRSGLYHHGDKPAADAISGLAATFQNNIPLLDGKGTFGSRVNPAAIGAPRYTYVKRSKAAQEIIFHDLDIVPQTENYDGSALEPLHFLPIVPVALLNGISGIAVGYSTEILPHSLSDLIDACLQVLEGKKVKKLNPSYDKFDVGIKNTGGNSWEFLGKIVKEDSSTAKILELPIGITLEKFKKKLDQLEDEGTIKGYTDNTTDEISIEIKFKRGEIKDVTEEELIELLKLKSKKTERITLVGWDNDGIIQYDTPEELVKDFVEWRIKWYTTRYERLLKNATNDLQYHQAIETCFEAEIYNYIGECESREQALELFSKITEDHGLESEKVKKIASVPLYFWNIQNREENKAKIEELQDHIQEYERILGSDSEIKNIYIQELKNLKSKKPQ